jgi:uncharacterized protein YlxP (DUF503 family)
VFVGLCRLVLRASHCHSLKEKRTIIRTVKDRVKSRYDIKLSEIASQDSWQRIELGFAVVTAEAGKAEEAVAAVVTFVDDLGLAQLIGQRRELVGLDEPAARPPDLDGWVPPEWEVE